MPIDIYERITARILEQLEADTIPWEKTWIGGDVGHPRNLVSDHRYRGINLILLAFAPYESAHWLTYKQAQSLGGNVRKGEKSTRIIYWKWLDRENEETGKRERFPLLRSYCVFNTEQCDLPPDKVPSAEPILEHDFKPIEVCERVVNDMPTPPAIERSGGTAAYRPSTDTVLVPEPERFENPENFYATLFHELAHSTGHEARLNRPGVTSLISFGSRSYSKEELIAEMGASFLCGHCGIENVVIENSAAYIAGWLKQLRDDKRLVVHAAAAAQNAADYILGLVANETDKTTDREGA